MRYPSKKRTIINIDLSDGSLAPRKVKHLRFSIPVRTVVTDTASVVMFLLISLGMGLSVLPSSCAQAADSPAASSDSSPGPSSTEWQPNYSSAGNRPGAGSRSMGVALREGPMGGMWQRNQLLGDPGGFRSWLGSHGASLTILETAEYLGNTMGGIRKDFDADGLTTVVLQVDTKRAFNLYGGLFNASALQVHGLNLSARNLNSLQTASGIEADDGLRLWELWYQQMFLFNQLDIKIGSQSLDQEFMVSQYAGLFVNTMFGWPMLTSADLLSGGPAYPLASLGVRLRAQPSGEPWAFLIGAYDDNPAGVNPQVSGQDPQQFNANGASFRLQDKPIVIAEVQYSRPAIGQLEYADAEPIHPGTYKLGFWYDFGSFADQQYGTDGLSLADPNSNGTAALIQGNYSLYAVIDQLVWREDAESSRGIGVFFRGMAAPSSQNPIDFSLNAGVTLHAPFFHREYDTCGIGIGIADVSPRARNYDRDNANFNAMPIPIRGSETFVEATYQYQVVPWWVLQPEAQFMWNPGAGASYPSGTTQRVSNELVLGLRTNISL